jgi:glycosyltransferase involved in cell wall biosynthesis
LSDSPEIEILLATYNGECFLREQIDSILAQDYTNLRILARDDGSSDGTPAILEQYKRQFPTRFHVMPTGKGTGHPKWNFLRLLQASTAGYVCFADQDDVWLPQKLTWTMQSMKQLEAKHGASLPLLTFTDLRIVDEHLKIQHESYWKLHHLNPRNANHFARLLGQNVVTGSTAMLNRPLIELASRMPEEAGMHDNWVALLAAAFGASVAVSAPTVLYRQHDNNVLGAGEAQNQIQMPRLRSHCNRRKRWKLLERQAQGILRVHGAELPSSKRKTIEAFLRCGQSPNRFARIGTALRYGFYVPWMRNHLSMLWYLWDIKSCTSEQH